MFRKAKKTGKWKTYNAFQKDCKRAIRKAEWVHVNNQIQSGFEEGSSKPFWQYIKSRRSDNVGVSPLKDHGQLVSDSRGKARILLEQFKSVFTIESGNPPDGKDLKEYPPAGTLQIVESGVLKLLKRINASKSNGPDNIPNRVLKECAESIAPILTKIFQRSVDTGVVPETWRNANISCAFKKGDRHLAENYRPISLTSVCCKLLEHIICKHMLNHFDIYRILTDLNHGFRAGYSCETQLVTTVNDFYNQYDSGKQVDAAVLDFSKAFDTVPHRALLVKLERYGIRGHLLDWIAEFLCNRKMRVVVDGETSDETDVKSGVPQGTVLGPLLFLVHINDLPDCVKSQVRLFADDCLLYRTINCFNDHLALQKDLDELCIWAERWGMKFNAKKCYILSIRNSSQHMYQIGGEFLKVVKNTPYLGVTISDTLSWEEHITKSCKKASSVLGFLRRNLRMCPEDTKRIAYLSLVRPILEYAAPVWDPHKARDIDRLERVQRQAIRFITGDYRSRDPGCVTRMMLRLDIPLLQERRKACRLTLMYKIVEGHLPAMRPDVFLVPLRRNKRPIRDRHLRSDFVNTSIVSRSVTNNSKCFAVPRCRTQPSENSYFPRTIREWNQLQEYQVTAESIDQFKASLVGGAVTD